MPDDPKKSPDSDDEEKDEPKKTDKATTDEKPKPVAKSKPSDEQEEEDEQEDEEEEEEPPSSKKPDPKVETKKAVSKKDTPTIREKRGVVLEALKVKPKPKPTGPIIIGPKEAPPAPKAPVVRRRTALILAEYGTPVKVLAAARKLRDAGYKRFDTHTPFPIHGMDAAMGLPDSKLGWIVLIGGLSGVTAAVTMIWWMNGVDYPIIIGGKPGFTLPASVPIMFELTVLFSAFSAVFGMLGLNKLPRHNHPIFESDRFRSASDDKFWVSVEAEDAKFDLKKTRTLLEGTNADIVEVVEEELDPEPLHEEEH